MDDRYQLPSAGSSGDRQDYSLSSVQDRFPPGRTPPAAVSPVPAAPEATDGAGSMHLLKLAVEYLSLDDADAVGGSGSESERRSRGRSPPSIGTRRSVGRDDGASYLTGADHDRSQADFGRSQRRFPVVDGADTVEHDDHDVWQSRRKHAFYGRRAASCPRRRPASDGLIDLSFSVEQRRQIARENRILLDKLLTEYDRPLSLVPTIGGRRPVPRDSSRPSRRLASTTAAFPQLHRDNLVMLQRIKQARPSGPVRDGFRPFSYLQ